MKTWHLIIIVLTSIAAGYFLHSAITKPKIITKYKTVEVVETAPPDTITIKTVDDTKLKHKDKEIADLRRRVSRLSYNKLKLEQEREYYRGQINDLTVEINADTSDYTFISQKMFYPDLYTQLTVMAHAPCYADSLQYAMTTNYDAWYRHEREPKIIKEMARGHLTWGAVGFAVGGALVLIFK